MSQNSIQIVRNISLISEINIENINQVWNIITNEVSRDFHVIQFYYNFFDILTKKNDLFLKNSPFISDLKKINENNIKFEEKIQILKKVAIIVQYLDQKTLEEYLTYIFALSNDDNSQVLPKDLISVVELFDFSSLDASFHSTFYNIFKRNKSKYDKAVPILAPIAVDLCASIPYLSQEVSQIITNGLKGNPYTQIHTLFLCERMSNYNYIDPDIYLEILPLLSSDDDDIFFRAHKAVRALLLSGALDYDMIIEQMLGILEKKPKNIIKFYKILEKAVDNKDNITGKEVKRLFTTLLNLVNLSSECIQGFLQVYSSAGAHSCGAVSEYTPKAIEFMKHLISSERVDSYQIIANCCVTISKCFGKDYNMTLEADIVPVLLESIELNMSIKSKLQISSDIAILANEIKISGINRLISFIKQSFDSINGTKVFYVCSLISNIASKLASSDARSIFELLANSLVKEKEKDIMNAILDTMNLLIDRFSDQHIVESLSDIIISGGIGYLHGVEPVYCRDGDVMIFHFLRKVVSVYQVLQKKYYTKLIEYLNISKNPLFPNILDLLKGFKINDINGGEIFTVLLKRFSELQRSDEETICSCLEALFIVLEESPNSFEHEKCLSSLDIKLFTETENSDEEEEEIEGNYAFASMIRLALCIYSKLDIPPSTELFENIVNLLPLDLGIEHIMLPLYDSLCDIVVKESFQQFVEQISKILVLPLSLSDDKRRLECIDDQLFEKLKQTVKFLIDKYPNLRNNLIGGRKHKSKDILLKNIS